MDAEPRALLVDITRCIGCRACMEACMERHGFTADPASIQELSSTANTVVLEQGDYFVRRMCMHCLTPSCASVCPVEALQKTVAGPVVYDASRCIGCRYCIQACPFNVPRYTWDRPVPSVTKCDLCAERAGEGRPPACAEACPAEATVSGFRRELLAEAHRRIEENPDTYYPYVYGEHDIGGTSVLFLSPVSFAELGLNDRLGTSPLPARTRQALERIPGIAVVGGAVLLGIWWITRRREEVARSGAFGEAVPQLSLASDEE